MNSINKKRIYAVVAIVTVYLLAFKVAQPDIDLRGGIGVIALPFWFSSPLLLSS